MSEKHITRCNKCKNLEKNINNRSCDVAKYRCILLGIEFWNSDPKNGFCAWAERRDA